MERGKGTETLKERDLDIRAPSNGFCVYTLASRLTSVGNVGLYALTGIL